MTLYIPGRGARSAPLHVIAAAVIAAAAIAACSVQTSPLAERGGALAAGTWGGDNAGLIVDDTLAHVHVGCTNGDFPAPVALDTHRRFSVAGSYLLRAYPIAVGPTVPARMTGVLDGATLTLTVAVDDTVQHKAVTLGPVTVTYGKQPKLGPCPICRKPRARARLLPRLHAIGEPSRLHKLT
jgi:hypothetical protein